MNEPLLVRATALILLFPNFAHRTFLHAIGVGVRLLKFFLVNLDHRATWAQLTVWMIAPLLIQFVKVLSVVVLGRPYLAGPLVWLYRVLNELILFQRVVLQPFHAEGTAAVGVHFILWPLCAVLAPCQP